MNQGRDAQRVITGLRHGGHAILDTAPNVKVAEQSGAVTVRLSAMVQDPSLAELGVEEAFAVAGATDFDYLFPNIVGDPAKHLPATNAAEVDATVAALNALGDAMIDQEPPADVRSSPIPPIYTYWGQFVDHDMTAATDRDVEISILETPLPPLNPADVVSLLKNARNPALNLDSVYGNGPFAPAPAAGVVAVQYQEQDRAKLKIGAITSVNIGVQIPPVDDLARDLPRVNKVAQIGDGRNDENLIVAQLHLAFLRFHNAAVDWVRVHEPEITGVGAVFLRARELTRWTYQWLCVHDFLRTVTEPDTFNATLVDDHDLLDLASRDVPYMPLEFSVAAYRFGHSMVRANYDWNRNFGRPGNNTAGQATFGQMFQFTGTGGFRGAPTLPSNWPAEWSRFVDKDSLFEDRFARKIDTHLAPPLSEMVNQIGDPPPQADIQTLLKHLARRNLLRGYRLGLPTGEAVAEELDIAPLTNGELTQGVDPAITAALQQGNFQDRTPLWFYVLREAERNAQGHTLGKVGSRIVAATIIGQIRRDSTSYLNQTSWTPGAGVRLPDGQPILSIADFLRFAGVL